MEKWDTELEKNIRGVKQVFVEAKKKFEADYNTSMLKIEEA